ncbi:phosphatidylinositol-specific phospholipase C domain-containing protein [Bacillus cereus group sp. BfR-BA-01349]|uniref:phosphatidylinositol-specific phospholipase C domain-containing protein n=1 Tax=Bacillus cereus group sp. BfR-BA-01349 TaxID=2920312 RepID=UPI0024142DEB
MAIYDVAADLFNLCTEYAIKHYDANPYSFHGATIYDRSVLNSEVKPDKVEFDVIPNLTNTVINTITNDTNVEQSVSTKLSTKTVETTSITTTEGYKVGSSIKNTLTFKAGGIFSIGGVEHSFEVSVSGEYNHSSSETKTNTKEKLWEYTAPIKVPPQTKVEGKIQIYSGSIPVPVTLKSTVWGLGQSPNGQLKNALTSLYYKDNRGKEWVDTYQVALLYTLRGEWSGYKPIYVGSDGSGVKLQGKATVDIDLGLYAVVTFKEEPLPGNQNMKNGRTYSKIIFRDGRIMDINCDSHLPNATDAGYHYNSSAPSNNPSWMNGIPGATKLSELSIPGTHGSIAVRGGGPIIDDIARNQRMSIATQLQAGIRYLDIRARRTGSSFAMHHGSVYQNLMFGDVLNQIQTFFRTNPRETVLMRLKEEHNPESGSQSFEDIFKRYKNDYGNLFWNYTSSNPTLDEVRGKIVLIQNFSASQNYGIQYGSLNIQDQYAIKGYTPDAMYGKWLAVKTHLSNADNSNRSQMYLNYLSGTGDGAEVVTKGTYPWFVASGYMDRDGSKGAKMITEHRTERWPDFPRGYYGQVFYGGMNILTAQFISRLNLSHTGIVAADFPGGPLINNVIRLNNRLSAGDIRYIRVEGARLKIGFQGNTFLQNTYVISRNGKYIAHVEKGKPYYSSLATTDFGYELTNSALLFTDDKIEVHLDKNGQRTLLQSQVIRVEGQEGEVQVPNQTFIIKSKLPGATNKAVDLAIDSGYNYNVHLWSYNDQLNAEWYFEYKSDKKAYVIWNSARPGRVMAWNDYNGSWNVFGTPFVADNEEHYWKVRRTREGYASLVNLKKRDGNEVVLDVAYGGTADGTSINVYYSYPGELNQAFRLIERAKNERASISSYYVPQSGQKNRSSNNFSLNGIAAGSRVRVEIHGDGESVLSFRIMRDKSGDTDPTIWSNVKHGTVLTIPANTQLGSLYIANPNPNNYNGYGRNRSFRVVFYTLPNQ